MSTLRRPNADDVEQIMLNARLRDELEPYFDESLAWVNVRRMPTQQENDFLASMLAWERAPIVPIGQWFEPELKLPSPEVLSEGELHDLLWDALRRLYEKRIVLDFSDHLTDRQLYCLLYRDILPTPEKKLDLPRNYLHWDCCDAGNNETTWLRFYATDEERQMWSEETGEEPPAAEEPPYCRKLRPPRQG